MAKRTVICTNNDLIILSRQIAEFQQTAEDAKLVLPAQASYIVHRNESLVLQQYTKYEKKRQNLLRNFIELDKDGKAVTKEVELENGEKTQQLVFKDEKGFEEAFNELLAEQVELQFHVPFNVEEKIENVTGEQKVLNQLWYLPDIFENWDPANKETQNEQADESAE